MLNVEAAREIASVWLERARLHNAILFGLPEFGSSREAEKYLSNGLNVEASELRLRANQTLASCLPGAMQQAVQNREELLARFALDDLDEGELRRKLQIRFSSSHAGHVIRVHGEDAANHAGCGQLLHLPNWT